MSEYQCYEFLALERPLTAKQMAELRAISTRAGISPTRFWNEYQWGDLKADPARLMERYFDAHVYFANWGTRRPMLRMPKSRLDMKALKPYFLGAHGSSFEASRDHVVLDLVSDPEEHDYDEPNQGVLAALAGLRTELMQGDLRPAYLAWLLAAQSEAADDTTTEPPVPTGLAKLTATQQAMVEFLRIDVDLIAAAAEASTADKNDGVAFRRWISKLSTKEKDAWLRRAADAPELAIGSQLLRAFRSTVAGKTSTARRRIGELRAAAQERKGTTRRAHAKPSPARRIGGGAKDGTGAYVVVARQRRGKKKGRR